MKGICKKTSFTDPGSSHIVYVLCMAELYMVVGCCRDVCEIQTNSIDLDKNIIKEVPNSPTEAQRTHLTETAELENFQLCNKVRDNEIISKSVMR